MRVFYKNVVATLSCLGAPVSKVTAAEPDPYFITKLILLSVFPLVTTAYTRSHIPHAGPRLGKGGTHGRGKEHCI